MVGVLGSNPSVDTKKSQIAVEQRFEIFLLVAQSVFRLVLLLAPQAEAMECLIAQEGDDGHRTLVEGTVEFFIDEVVGKLNVAGVLTVVTIEDTADAGPVDGSETHGARLAGGVDGASREVERAQTPAGFADGVYLSMCRRVEIDGDAVATAGDDLAVLDNDRPERPAAMSHALVGQTNGLAHELLVLFCNLYHSHILTI